jgi:hypothetical protein
VTVTRGATIGSGGGILNRGTLTLRNSTIANSRASSEGGGLFNDSIATVSVSRTLIVNNVGTSSGNGAGVANRGSMILAQSTVAHNIGQGAIYFGAGIFNTGGLSVVGSTVHGNVSHGSGGGLWNSGTLNLYNSTIAYNTSLGNTGGGAIRVVSGSAFLSNCTVVRNFDGSGTGTNAGGISVDGAASLLLNNTVVAENFASGGLAPNVRGAVTGSGNFIGAAGAELTGITNGVDGNRIGTIGAPLDPLLGALQDNGGPTLTCAPLPGSPLINQAFVGAVFATDQRGFKRLVGAKVDIGAVEFRAQDA